MASDQVQIGPDTARSNDHRLRGVGKLTDDPSRAPRSPSDGCRLQDRPTDPRNDATSDDQAIHLVPEAQFCHPFFHCLANPGHKGLQHPRARTPGDMKTRNGIPPARSHTATTLRPPYDRKEPNTKATK